MRTIFGFLGAYAKKAIIVVTVYGVALSLLFSLGKPDVTQTPTPKPESPNAGIYRTLNNPEFQKTDEGKIKLGMYRITMCNLVGAACTDNPADDTANFNGSLFGKVNLVFASPFMHPPASGIAWTQETLAKAGILPEVYAAEGIGFAALRPFTNLWQIFRNVAYTLMVLLIITIGFMIMFRAKIDPQTVISVENSLPRIVFSLLFITLSFPIAGFMIDLMYLLIGLGISVLAQVDPNYSEMQMINDYYSANLGTLWSSVFVSEGSFLSKIPIYGPLWDLTRMGNAIVGLLPDFLNQAVQVATAAFIAIPVISGFAWAFNFNNIEQMFNNIDLLGNSLGALPGGVLGFVLRFGIIAIILPFLLINGAGFIFGILMLFTIIFLVFRIFFMLLMGYIRIALMSIFASLFPLMDVIPGQNFTGTWLLNLFGEILMFVITVYLLIVGRAISNTIISAGANNWQPPFLYGIEPEHFSLIVGMGIIFLIPDLVKLVKETLGIKGLPIQIGLGTYFSGAGAIAGGGLGGFSQLGNLAQAAPGVRGLLMATPIGKFSGIANFLQPRDRQEGAAKSTAGGT